MSQEVALAVGLLPIILVAVVYAVHLARVAARAGATGKTAHSVECSRDKAQQTADLSEELRGVRLELRALREALERSDERQR